MKKEWAELNKTMQLQLKKKDTFDSGIATLLKLRKEFMKQIIEFKTQLNGEYFSMFYGKRKCGCFKCR